MRLKIRSPAGQEVLTFADDATVSTLLDEIRSKTSITSELEIKCGFPPKPLQLSDHAPTDLLKDLPVKLNGEQLTVSGTVPSGNQPDRPSSSSAPSPPSSSSKAAAAPSVDTPFSFSGKAQNRRKRSSTPPLSLTPRQKNKDDPPDAQLPGGRGTLALRVMEDDNSCLFRAISYVLARSVMSVEELRQLVAGVIQDQTEKYSEAVLEQKPDAYCEWIKMDSSWGGGIELGIFASFFEVEILTIDVATGNVIRFNEGRPKRVIVVYSGIHYDAIALVPAGTVVHDSSRDETTFGNDDKEVLVAAQELCSKLKAQKYFTNTKSFALKCNVCKKGLKGEKAAVEHAKQTGHTDFGEY